MDYITVRQVSQDYGVSARMLRYYEQIGLLESKRIDDYAYRVYDEVAIKKLQQIIILRKLQIPMKQIKEILNNQDAVTVIEVFKQNISELDEQITALSTVKSILSRFVEELQEKADVRLKLDLLNDTTMLAVMNAISFSENKIKENISKEVLGRASETLSKESEKSVKIVYRPPATIAEIRCHYDPSGEKWNARIKAETITRKFIEDTNLYKLKPDMRVWGATDGKFEYGTWQIWITIPDDFEIQAPFTKKTYHGGLFATHPAGWDFDFGKWAENSNKYQWCHHNSGTIEEYFNPFNIYGLKNTDYEITGAMSAEVLFPIREIDYFTEYERLSELDRLISSNKTTNIELTSLVKCDYAEPKYANGLMEISVRSDYQHSLQLWGMATPQHFNFPLKIELRAKTTGNDIIIRYGYGSLIINCVDMKNNLTFFDIIVKDKMFYHCKSKDIPANEFVDIEWVLGRYEMVVKINGELRDFNSNHWYINAFNKNPELSLSSEVGITTAPGITVTVESLRVTEL